MAKPRFTRSQVRVPPDSRITSAKFVEARVNAGVITMIDPLDIPPGALQTGKNIIVRFDRTSRRPGSVLLDPAKPDSNEVLGLAFIKLKNGVAYTFRFTATSIYSRNALDWTEVTGGGLTGLQTDRFQVVNVLNRIIFTNNGADVVQEIDPAVLTYAALGNAPTYRYVTGFYNRAVGAALRGSNEVQVGWSADGVIDEWDPAVNKTAGNSPILESPSDLSDYITGIFGFTNVMILLREQSIWLATKKPIPTDPFNFYAVFPGIGCDVPSSVAVIPNGLAWLDTRTGTVWAYTPGGAPEPIGRSIEANLLRGVDDPSQCFGSYASKPNEYTVAIPRAGSTLVTTWTYNFRTKAWAEGEYESITSIDDIELATGGVVGSGLTIDDLIGTIDQLVGNIDELGPAGPVVGPDIIANVRLFGKSNGDVLLEDETVDTDNGTEFETLIDSKTFQIPTDDMMVMELRLEFLKKLAGSFEIYWSKDGGKTFSLYRTVADTYIPIGESKIVKTFGPMKARNYVWRIRATEGAFDILAFEVLVSQSGKSITPS